MPRLNRFIAKFISMVSICIAAGLAGPSYVGAIPANPNPFTETQPDGTRITLHIRGDEYFHWLEDSAGFTVMKDTTGAYVYGELDAAGELVPTSLRVGAVSPAGAGLAPGLLPPRDRIAQIRASKLAPAPGAPKSIQPIGNIKNVVILMRFSNHTTRPAPTHRDIGMIFNHVGPHPLCPTGSVRDNYLENSYGACILDSTVFGWVTLPQSETYYADGQSGGSAKIQEAIADALNAADALINFSEFDLDEDSFVDAIAFIHSGYGAEWGGTDEFGTTADNRIWSHRSNIPVWTSAEGVKVSAYHISPGLWGTSGAEPGRIGVICHETGHFFGLPDLYDTDGSSEGVGNWCMMSGGSWGFDGEQQNPSHMSAWCKVQLGWAVPTVITPGSYVANRVEETPQIFKVTNGYPSGEYLLIENRQPFGFEPAIPQGGLAVWHVDESKANNTQEGYPGQSGWPGNNRHYRVALLQADGEYDLEHNQGRGDSGDLYHGGGVTSIGPFTLPNTHAYKGGAVIVTNNQITQIGPSGASMAFAYGLQTGPSPSPSQTPSVTPSATPAPVIQLENGVPIPEISGASGSARRYKITTPQGATKLTIQISGGTGDCDLYVRFGQAPTLSQYDYRPYLDGNDETVVVNNPAAGDWHVMLDGFITYSGLTLFAVYCPSAPCDNPTSTPTPTPTPSPSPTEFPVTALENGVPVTEISGAIGSERRYKIASPQGATRLLIQTHGGTGDCDVYVRHGQPPTLEQFDFRPFLAGNMEFVEVASPSPGDWYVSLQGYDTYADATLVAILCPSAPCDPTVTPTPTASPSRTPTLTPSVTQTPTPSLSPSRTSTPSPSPSRTSTPTISSTATSTPTAAPSLSPSATPVSGARIGDVLLGRSAAQPGDDLNGDGAVDIADLLLATLP